MIDHRNYILLDGFLSDPVYLCRGYASLLLSWIVSVQGGVRRNPNQS
jgi:hypothetical protein